MDKERIDEALELIWLLEEEGRQELNRFKLSSEDDNVEEIIAELEKEGLAVTPDDTIRFTENGRSIARGLIRRHRLAERLFTDVFELDSELVHTDACKMEHILSEELTDSVCTFLGHPQTCPHSKPIPRGDCCKKYKVEVEPVVVRLSDSEVGSMSRIVFMIPSETLRLSKLGSIGITAGSVIKLLQKRPSYVIQVDETTIAIDPDIAKEIFVKKVV